jgi:hypothetical protein
MIFSHLPLDAAPVWWHFLLMDVVCRICRWMRRFSHLPLDAALFASATGCRTSLVAFPVDGCSLPHLPLDAALLPLFCLSMLFAPSGAGCGTTFCFLLQDAALPHLPPYTA